MTNDKKDNKPLYDLSGEQRGRLAEQLVKALMDENAPGDIYDRLLDWFNSHADDEEKFAALEKYMNDNLAPSLDLNNEANLKRFRRLAEKLNIKIRAPRQETPRPETPGREGHIYMQPPRRKMPRSTRILARIAVAAAVFAVVTIGGLTLWDHYGKPSAEQQLAATHHVSVPAGETKHLTLDDGTEVTLNGKSEFSYGDDRECTLSGEGYFKVAKADKSFIVHTDHMDVTVLGTEFNLSAARDSALSVLALYSGSVKLEYEGGSHRLSPGMEFTYDSETHLIDVKRIDISGENAKPAWLTDAGTSGVYSLGEIFGMIESEFGIVIENKAVADTAQRFSFMLEENDSVDTIMTSLSIASGDFEYTVQNNRITLGKAKK